MSVSALIAFHITRHPLLRYVVDRNPFYLLSAVCMLFGLLTLTNSLSFSSIPSNQLLILIGTLNCYEVLLIGIALWLIISRGLVRDGMILLGIEAFFIADTAFLNQEILSADLQLGVLINCALLVLAACKLAVVFRVMRWPLVSGAFPMLLAQLALLFVVPAMFKHLQNIETGKLSPLAIYAAWWAAGLLPVLFVAALPHRFSGWGYRPLLIVFTLFAFLSLLLHLGTSNWVYKVRWESANVSPMLLGLAVAIGGYHTLRLPYPLRAKIEAVLPILAVYLSLGFRNTMMFDFAGLSLSPLRLALLGTMLAYVHGYWIHRTVYFLVATTCCMAAALGGATWQLIYGTTKQAFLDLLDFIDRMRPRTSQHWGILAVVSSFLFLGIGIVLSILKGWTDEERRRTE